MDTRRVFLSIAEHASVSEQLYSSKYRFLYEIIQNADDSEYRNVQPLLNFKVTPRALVIETNEEGFSRENVAAICETGQSSKKRHVTDEHTGEKGFGFKSVFSIADDVHIQSGLWSFRFKHRQGDDGLGMVTPLDAEAENLPRNVTTRITLNLSSDAAKDYNRLLEAIADMPDTTLLFLRRLSKLRIEIENIDTNKEVICFDKSVSDEGRLVAIDRSRKYGESQPSNTVTSYHRTTYVQHVMPEDKHRKNQQKTTIDLAFPVNSDKNLPQRSPMGQHIFAYLPLKRLSQLQVS